MTNVIFLLAILALVTGCSTLYYGYLPGADYKIYQNKNEVDLNGKIYRLEVMDVRKNINTIECVKYVVDRKTELEGETGLNLVKEYAKQSIEHAHGKISSTEGIPLKVELEAISFNLDGFVQITAEGLSQIKVTIDGKEKRYCERINDRDEGAPLKWYSFDTRVGASRKMASAAVRLVMDQLLDDLKNLK